MKTLIATEVLLIILGVLIIQDLVVNPNSIWIGLFKNII